MGAGREGRLSPWTALLAAVCLASAATILALGSRLTFYNDDWYVLLQRPGWSAESILSDHNGHLSAVTVLVYKGLVAVAGLDSQLPFRLVGAAIVVSLAVAVFLFVRERLGPPLAVVAAALLLFLGPAWQDLLWTFEIGLMGSMAAGIGALLALERDTRGSDRAACALLLISLLFSNLGVPFVIAATVEVLVLRRRPAQAWIPAIPALLFALWWIAYGHDAPSHFSLGNVARAPAYVLDAMSAGLAALAGLTQAPGGVNEPLAWGRPLLALSAIGIAIWLLRGGRPAARLLVVAAAAFTFWLLAGFNFTAEFRNPIESRYLIVSGAFLILLGAELFRSARLPTAAVAAIALWALVAIAANLGPLKQGNDFFRSQTVLTRADLGALDLARRQVAADFTIPSTTTFPGGRVYLRGLTASDYFRERDEHGSPAYSPAEIAAAPLAARQSADAVLGLAYDLHLSPLPPPGLRSGGEGCRRLTPPFDTSTREVRLPPGGALLTNLGGVPVELGLRRFADHSLPVGLEDLAGGLSARLEIPVDGASVPWHLGAGGGSPLRVCRVPSSLPAA
jgi:hypothetical protein